MSPDDGIRCVVFDFDGVLVDSNKLKRRAYYEVFSSITQDQRMIRDTVQAMEGSDRFETIRAILAKLNTDAQASVEPSHVASLAEQYNAICESGAAEAPEMPEASQVLSYLSGRFPLYVNSGTPETVLCRIVLKREWDHYFRGVFGSPSSKVENLVRISRLEGCRSENVMMVGDSRIDLEASLEFGCAFCAYGSEPSSFGSVHRIAALSEVREVLGA